ncbi:hypothetical protein [Lonepinella sp. BR2271]|uniref:hypothetical protein n=1 Tax=Lonepinella sp. BR2271 TaxID=3434550 RepID=UPI003F6DE471
MLKKISAVLFLIILASCALIYVQSEKIRQNFTALLAENAVQVENLHVNLFPRLTLRLDNVHYTLTNQQHIQAETITFWFNWQGLFTGDLQLSNLGMHQVEFVQPSSTIKSDIILVDLLLTLRGKQSVSTLLDQIKAQKGDFPPVILSAMLKNHQGDQWIITSDWQLQGNSILLSYVNLELTLQNKKILNTQHIDFLGENGEVHWSEKTGYLFHFQQGKLNQIDLGHLLGNWQAGLAPITPQFTLHGQRGDAQFRLQLQSPTKTSPQTWQIQAEKVAIAPLLTSFGLTELVSGKANVDIQLVSDNFIPRTGEFAFDVIDGKVKGLNLLTLISQYVPLNIDESMKNIDTTFDFAHAKFHWLPDEIEVEQAKLAHQYFTLQSQGKVDLIHGRCDFLAHIAVRDPRYQSLSLPVHFFGNCQSPEYKVDIQRNFRDQLKNFIKEKLK